MDTEVTTIYEFLQLNEFDATVEAIESGINARRETQNIYNIPDDYLDDDEFTSGALDER